MIKGLMALLVLGIIGVATDNRKAHGIIIAVALPIQVIGLGAAMFNPGSY